MSIDFKKNIGDLVSKMQLGIYTLEMCNDVKENVSGYLQANDLEAEKQLKYIESILKNIEAELKQPRAKVPKTITSATLIDPYEKANLNKLMGDIYAEIGYFRAALFHYQQEEKEISALIKVLDSEIAIAESNKSNTKDAEQIKQLGVNIGDFNTKLNAANERKKSAEEAFARVGKIYYIAMKHDEDEFTIVTYPEEFDYEVWKHSFITADKARINEVNAAIIKMKPVLSFADLFEEFKKCEKFPIKRKNIVMDGNGSFEYTERDDRAKKLAGHMYQMAEFDSQSEIQKAEVMISWYNSPLNTSAEVRDEIYTKLVAIDYMKIDDRSVLSGLSSIMLINANYERVGLINARNEALDPKKYRDLKKYYDCAYVKQVLKLIDESEFEDAKKVLIFADPEANQIKLAFIYLKLKENPDNCQLEADETALIWYNKKFIDKEGLLTKDLMELINQELEKKEVIANKQEFPNGQGSQTQVPEGSPPKSNTKKYAIAAAVGVAVCLLIIASLFIPPVAAGLAAVFGSLLVAGLVVGGSGVVIGGAAAGATLAAEVTLEKSAEKKMGTDLKNPTLVEHRRPVIKR